MKRNLLAMLAFLGAFGLFTTFNGYIALAACNPLAANKCGLDAGCPLYQKCEVTASGPRCIRRAECGACTSPGVCGPNNGCQLGYICNVDGSCTVDSTRCTVEQTGQDCTDEGKCGPPDADNGTCPSGQMCTRSSFNLKCKANTNCTVQGDSGTACSHEGCGYGCDADNICTRDEGGGHYCAASTACRSGNSCSGEGCGNGCAPGYKCTRQPEDGGYRCEASNNCGIVSCSSGDSSGCSATGCGYGYACKDGTCIVDATCTPTTVQSEYEGPKITQFSGLMARFYNLFFPLAILYGVIMILKAGYILMTSEGNPQKTRGGQEDLTAALLGTIFVVLSAAILRIIIVQILGGSVGF